MQRVFSKAASRSDPSGLLLPMVRVNGATRVYEGAENVSCIDCIGTCRCRLFRYPVPHLSSQSQKHKTITDV